MMRMKTFTVIHFHLINTPLKAWLTWLQKIFRHANPYAQHISVDPFCSLDNTCSFLLHSSPGWPFPSGFSLGPTSPGLSCSCFPRSQPDVNSIRAEIVLSC
ncbi:uncharacterized protein LOC106997166 isoform X2 [Macaca mulatta]